MDDFTVNDILRDHGLLNRSNHHGFDYWWCRKWTLRFRARRMLYPLWFLVTNGIIDGDICSVSFTNTEGEIKNVNHDEFSIYRIKNKKHILTCSPFKSFNSLIGGCSYYTYHVSESTDCGSWAQLEFQLLTDKNLRNEISKRFEGLN